MTSGPWPTILVLANADLGELNCVQNKLISNVNC